MATVLIMLNHHPKLKLKQAKVNRIENILSLLYIYLDYYRKLMRIYVKNKYKNW